MTPVELADVHVRVLFVHDADQRLVGVNEPGGGAPPRLFLARTSAGNLWRAGSGVSPELQRELEAVARTEPVEHDPSPEPHRLAEYLSLLASDVRAPRVWMGPAFVIAESAVAPASSDASHLCRVDHACADVLDAGFASSKRELLGRQPLIACVDAGGRALSVCYTARATERAHEAGVDTLAAHRGKGLACRTVAAWANAVRELGRLPLYSTAWENAASRGVARKLGMQRYAVTFSVT